MVVLGPHIMAIRLLLFAGVVDDSVVAQRSRESVYPLISVDEALQIVMAEADVMDVENVRLTGRIRFHHFWVCKL